MNAEDAFAPTQDRSHFFASSAANAVLAQLEQGLVHALPVTVVTGEAGVGKTCVLREACARWGARVRAEWLDLDGTPADTLLSAMTRAFEGHVEDGAQRSERVAELVRALSRIADGDQTPVLVIEQAHTMPVDVLMELARIVSALAAAKSKLRVVISGQPGLDKRLVDPALVQLTELIAVRTRLMPLPVADVRPYLNHRVTAAGGDGERVFSRRSARELHTASRGVPAGIDSLAADAIRIARGTNAAQVAPEHVKAAVAATQRPRATAAPAATKAATAAPGTEAHAKPRRPAAASAASTPVAPQAPADTSPAASAAPAPLADDPAAAVAPAEPGTGPPAAARRPASLPRPEAPPLDSAHPRVKEWVSRFTDGEGVLRFGARMQLPPLTEPDALPVFDDTPPASSVTTRRMVHTLRAASKPAVVASAPASEPASQPAPPPAPEPTVPEPAAIEPSALVEPALVEPSAVEPAAVEPLAPHASEPEPEPIAFVPQPEHDDVPDVAADVMTPVAAEPEIVIVPEPIVLDPAALEPRPLELPAAEPFELTAIEPRPVEPEPRAIVPAPSAPAPTAPPKLPALPALPGTPVAARPEPGSSRRSKKRKRERERAARALQQAGAAASMTPSGPKPAPRPAPQPVPPPVPAAASGRLVTEESVHVQPPAPPAAGAPAPEPWNSGPRSPRHTSRFVQAVVPLALMVGVAAIAIFASTRTGFDQNRARTQVTSTAPVVPAPDSIVATPAPSPEPAVTAPVAAPKPPRYCLAVGTFLFNERAQAKARQLARRTRMKAWVEPGMADGSRTYRILIGGFATEGEAERVADRLLARGFVSEAMVENVPAEDRDR